MSWGSEPHEARADGPMPDASSNGGSSRGDDPDPIAQLILARDHGGERPFPDGRRVHTGATLQRQLTDGSWAAVRYERERGDTLPSAYMDPALTDEAWAAGSGPPQVDVAVPTGAILRWSQW